MLEISRTGLIYFHVSLLLAIFSKVKCDIWAGALILFFYFGFSDLFSSWQCKSTFHRPHLSPCKFHLHNWTILQWKNFSSYGIICGIRAFYNIPKCIGCKYFLTDMLVSLYIFFPGCSNSRLLICSSWMDTHYLHLRMSSSLNRRRCFCWSSCSVPQMVRALGCF